MSGQIRKKEHLRQEVQIEMRSELEQQVQYRITASRSLYTTTYTRIPGTFLMIPNLIKLPGEQLPGVFNVSARALANPHACISEIISDVYACRQTESQCLANPAYRRLWTLTPVAHCAAPRKGKVPFINFFDGFRTPMRFRKSRHGITKTWKDMVDMDAVDAFRVNCPEPEPSVPERFRTEPGYLLPGKRSM